MKTLTRMTACAVVFAATALAQGRFGPMAGPAAGSGPDTATMVSHHVAMLTNLLTLTAAQQSQATTIFTNAANAVQPLQTSLTTAQQTMQTAVKNNATAVIADTAAKIGSLHGQIAGIHRQADAAFYATLTADQKTKFDQTGGRGCGAGMMGGGFMGGRGMMGGAGMGFGRGMMGGWRLQ